MKLTYKTPLLTVVCVIYTLLCSAQIQRYPATVNPGIGLPYSLFISDYTDPVRQKLSANVHFHDFNESQWTFKLRIRIENTDIVLETLPGFTPSIPIIVSPGEPVRLSGTDWIEYLDYKNLTIRGPGRQALLLSGRLPEGAYTVTMQVLDYDTGDPLSLESQFTWWMGLFNPPLLVFPSENAYVKPTETQINFTWQLFGANSPYNVLSTEFQLTIWELTEQSGSVLDVDPLSALQNGQALQVFQSDRVTTNSLVYGPAEPALEAGKVYIYRLQAFDPEGRDSFKNNGQSEFRRFFYGWPTGGHIQLIYPEDERSLTSLDEGSIKWYPPDKKVPIQPVDYEIRIAEKEKNQSAQDALSGDLWHHEELYSISDGLHGRTIPPATRTKSYAWEIIGRSDGQEVGRSVQQVFHGPPLLELFYAGTHIVRITSLNDDPDNLTGTGVVRLDPSDNGVEVEFSGLKVRKSGLIWSLEEGEILVDTEFEKELEAVYADNGPAFFVADRLRLNKDGLWTRGKLEWRTHLPVLSDQGGPAIVATDWHWFNYDEYLPVGTSKFPPDRHFDLLDPYGFRLELDTSSWISVNEGIYSLQMDGKLIMPDNVLARGSTERIKIPFFRQEQLFYFETGLSTLPNPIKATSGLSLFVDPYYVTVDLSEAKSSGQFSDDPEWKGVVFDEYDLTIPTNFDPTGKVTLSSPIERTIRREDGGLKANVASGGTYLTTEVDFDNEPFTFSTFPSMLNRIVLVVEKSEVSDKSSIAGNTIIPILSETKTFGFRIPMSSLGTGTGYFEDIEGHTFTFNSDQPEQKIEASVRRAVMEENERVSMTLDLSWTALGIKMENVQYFKAWGNYNVGFYTPEGIYALENQLSTTYKGYPVTIDAVSAGRNAGKYGFGISGKITLGDDVSGDDGAPAFNMYSIARNSRLPGTYRPLPKQEGGGVEMVDNLDNILAEYESNVKSEEANLLTSLDELTADMNSQLGDDISSASVQLGGVAHLPEEVIVTQKQEVTQNGFSWDESTTTEEKIEIASQLIGMTQTEFSNPFIRTIVLKIIENEQATTENITEYALDLLKTLVAKEAAQQSLRITQPLSNQVQKLHAGINEQVYAVVGDVNQEIEALVGDIVDKAAGGVVDALSSKSPDIGGIVAEIALATKASIILEINGSINQSVYDNVTFPIAVLLEDQLLGRVQRYVSATTEEVVIAALTSGEDPAAVMKDRFKDIDDVIGAMMSDVLTFVDPGRMSEMVKSLGTDAVANIDPDRIAGGIKQGALEAIAGYVADKISDGLGELANRALGEEIGIAIPLDVGVAAAKTLISGGSVKDVLADPVPVKLRSPTVDLNGLIWLTEDHPVYGDVFTGAIDAVIKVPDPNKPFSVSVAYMNGRKEGVSYWFVEAGAGAMNVQQPEQNSASSPEGMDNVGGEMPEGMQEVGGGFKIGIMELMAIRGRVYKHMSGDPVGEMIPDAANKFGAYLHLVTFGPESGNKVRLEIEGQVNTFTDGNLIINFEGNLQLDNTNPQVLTIDPTASIQGEIEIAYNKHERHFMGYAGVKLACDGICGQGSLLVDVKPGVWRVALGSRDNRLELMPGCVGLRYLGWIDLNSQSVEVGLGLGLGLVRDFGVNLGFASAELTLTASVDVLVFGSAQYKPIKVNEIGLFVEAWALINGSYKAGAKSGSIELVDIYVYGSAIMRFNPKPTVLYGEVKGRISILQLFQFSFDKDYEVGV